MRENQNHEKKLQTHTLKDSLLYLFISLCERIRIIKVKLQTQTLKNSLFYLCYQFMRENQNHESKITNTNSKKFFILFMLLVYARDGGCVADDGR